MPKVTYNARSADEAQTVNHDGHTFEHGKAVDVPDHVAERLKTNPWFKVHGETKQQTKAKADAPTNPGQATEGGPSSTNINYPPGIGQKTDPPSVLTPSGETRPPVEGTQEAQDQMRDAQTTTGKRRGHTKKTGSKPGRKAKGK